MNAIDLFDCTADRMGAAPAIVSSGETNATPLTFAALAERSRRLATLFAQVGLEQGDAVLVFLPVGETFFAVTAALLRAGLIAVFVDPAAWRVTLAAALAGVRVRGFVGTPVACALRWCLPELRRIPHVFVAGHWPGACALGTAARLPMFATPAACDRNSVALVSFTSGTTGRPKGVLRTHSVLVATQRALAGELELREGETHLSVLPFVVLANLGAGATSVLPDGNRMRPAQLDPARIAAQIRAHRVDVVVASPMVADRLATHASATRAFDSLRRVYLGGAPVLPPLLDRWRDAAPGATITVLYGATEAEPIASLHADGYGDAERRATREGAGVLVGSPVPDVDVWILADHHGTPVGPCTEAEFAALSLAAGVEGEIAVAGPHVAPGYLGGEGNLLAGIEAGGRHWHRTGDAGYLDSSRRLWLTGRCANRTTLGPGVMHALRIEAALAGEPAVARAAFLQHGDQRLLVIEPAKPDAPVPLDRIAAQIAFASPDAIAVIERMPMDARHAAKIDYRRLEHDVTAGRTSMRWPPRRGGPERLPAGPRA